MAPAPSAATRRPATPHPSRMGAARKAMSYGSTTTFAWCGAENSNGCLTGGPAPALLGPRLGSGLLWENCAFEYAGRILPNARPPARIHDGADLVGFAVCHLGPGGEATSGVGYVKFGAVRAGDSAPRNFGRLLSACEALAASAGADRLLAGVNSARHHACRMMLDRGFRTQFIGVAMQRPNDPGWIGPDCFVMDDWR